MGYCDARSFSLEWISRFAHTGQPQPTTRDLTCARHSCPFSHIHQTIRWLPGKTRAGSMLLFRVGCHWQIRSGNSVAISFSPDCATLPVQTGQPVPPPVLVYTAACQRWPFSHCHQTLRLLPRQMQVGVMGKFVSTTHCSSSSCRLSRMQKSYRLSRMASPPFRQNRHSE